MTPAYRRPPGRNDLPTDGGPEDDRPSKTQLKREMDALQDLGETGRCLRRKHVGLLKRHGIGQTRRC